MSFKYYVDNIFYPPPGLMLVNVVCESDIDLFFLKVSFNKSREVIQFFLDFLELQVLNPNVGVPIQIVILILLMDQLDQVQILAKILITVIDLLGMVSNKISIKSTQNLISYLAKLNLKPSGQH